MSPIVGNAKGYRSESALARLLGSGMLNRLLHVSQIYMPCLYNIGSAGIAELAVFHPVSFSKGLLQYGLTNPLKVDTIAKRLMSNRGKVRKRIKFSKLDPLLMCQIDNLCLTTECRNL